MTDNTINPNVYRRGRILIIAMALVAAILQGNPFTSVVAGASRQPQILILFTLGFISLFFFGTSVLKKSITEEGKILFIIFFGMLMRMGYILFMDIYTLQNDPGTYTGFGTENINNGHIGYAEYLYKFMHMPDMDPYDHFGYYHPPLHHIIEALWLTLQRLIGVPEALAFENLQIPTLIYSGLCMLVMLHILSESGISRKLTAYGMLLFAFQPKLLVLAGSVNNDILALLLLLTTIWRTLAWIREKSFRNIILIALSLGFGMISKLNTAICAFSIALIYLIHLIVVCKRKNTVEIKNTFLQYVVFGIICIPIGLSYIVRNLVLFGEKPGIPSPALIPEDSVMYTGPYSVWSIIGIPTISDLHIEFPFHPLSAAAIHNSWVIMFQTGVFAEAYPSGISEFLLAIAQIAYIGFIITLITTGIAFLVIYTGKLCKEIRQKEEVSRTLFLLSTYVFMLISFGLFVFKYPYTCSSDFRYMVATMVFNSLGFALIQDKLTTKAGICIKSIMNLAMVATLICSLLVYMNWDI